MMKTFVISLLLATRFHEGSFAAPGRTRRNAAPVSDTPGIADDATALPSPVSVDDQQLDKIGASCLTRRDHEQLSGGILRYGMARVFNVKLANEAQKAIGLAELRAVAGFAPPRPWAPFREPSLSNEIAAATPIEEYYALREPRSEERSLDSADFFEWNFPPAIDFLDARFPAIRLAYRHAFQAIYRRQTGANARIDRNTVERMIDGYRAVSPRVGHVITTLILNDDCS